MVPILVHYFATYALGNGSVCGSLGSENVLRGLGLAPAQAAGGALVAQLTCIPFSPTLLTRPPLNPHPFDSPFARCPSPSNWQGSLGMDQVMAIEAIWKLSMDLARVTELSSVGLRLEPQYAC